MSKAWLCIDEEWCSKYKKEERKNFESDEM